MAYFIQIVERKDMENIPIIIVHKGNSFYLEPVLKQIRLFNPDNRICLISTEDTKHYDFVEHFLVDYYMKRANKFAESYVHLSINPYEYELFCFQRWFVIQEFAKEQDIPFFLCLDSDVLIYCDIDEVFNKYLQYDFTICKVMGPCFTLFNTTSIARFCDYMFSFYLEPQKTPRLEAFYKEVKDGGVCDMTMFTWYQQDVSNNVFDLIYPTKEKSCFDGNIADAMGFEMEKGKKRIYWIDDRPFGKLSDTGEFIRFDGLHLQGGAKHHMLSYLLNDNKVHEISFLLKMRWNFSGKRLNARYHELKKILSSSRMFKSVLKRKFGIK